MQSRSADAFFYGLFMDPDLLRSKGLTLQHADLAFVDGLAIQIGQRVWCWSQMREGKTAAEMAAEYPEGPPFNSRLQRPAAATNAIRGGRSGARE